MHDSEEGTSLLGSALGPEWVSGAFNIPHNPRRLRSKEGFGALVGAVEGESSVLLETECEVAAISSAPACDDVEESNARSAEPWPLRVELSNGRVYGCDYVVSAIGVLPNSEWVASAESSDGAGIRLDADGGIAVDDMLLTSIPDVFAAGDVCSIQAKPASGPTLGVQNEEEKDEMTEPDEIKPWHQMRLWTQARSLGIWAAACMLGYQDQVQSPYELFSHATQFMGYKVILLGRYNAQGLPADADRVKMYIRTVPNEEYVKAVLLDGRLVGAVLLGETDLEETFENLIMNGFDLSFIGDQLLNPDIDLEDYFD